MSKAKAHKFILPNWLENVLIFAFGILFFVFILVNRIPFPFRPIALQARYGLTLFAPTAFLVLFLAYKIKGFAGKALSFILILSLFAFALSGLWASGKTEPQVISGLLPTVDAGEYYYDALRLLNGSPFSDFSSRRPIFTALFSLFLFLTGKNLQASLAIVVAIAGIVCYLAADEVHKRWGAAPAAFFLLMLFFFYRRFTGRVMTENLGFAMGVLGFALLLLGIDLKHKISILLSIFLITLGLNVRAGPFFILIGLLVGGMILFYQRKRINLSMTALIVLVIILGFFLNFLVFKSLGSSSGIPFSNFSYSLYGLVNNGAGWTKIVYDHPEIFSLPEPKLSNTIYHLAFESFKANPLGIVRGALRQYGLLFNFKNSNLSIYSYVSGENRLVFHITQILICLLAIVGLIHIIRQRRNPLNYLLIFALVGILISVPFSPPGDSSNMRVFAVAIPFIVLLPAIGLFEIVAKFPLSERKIELTHSKDNFQIVTGFSLLLLIISILIPITLRYLNQPQAFPEIRCQSGLDLVVVNLVPGSYVKILPESQFFLDWMPNFHDGRFKQNIHAMTTDELVNEFKTLKAPVEIVSTINLKDGKDMFLIINDQSMFEKFGKYSICGQWSKGPQVKHFSQFFYSETFAKIVD